MPNLIVTWFPVQDLIREIFSPPFSGVKCVVLYGAVFNIGLLSHLKTVVLHYERFKDYSDIDHFNTVCLRVPACVLYCLCTSKISLKNFKNHHCEGEYCVLLCERKRKAKKTAHN